MSVSALASTSRPGQFLERANIRAALLLAIGLVGIVYHLLLAGSWQPQGWQWVADWLLHTVIPLLVLADWLAFSRKDTLSFRALPFYFAWPLAYSAYILLRAPFDGFYPYPFLDVTALGYPAALLNMVAVAAAFGACATALILLGRRLAKLPVRQPA